MVYRLVADLIAIAHLAYVLFVILGLGATLLGWALQWRWVRNVWFRGVHLTMISIVVLEAWAGITCPLTTWEQEFRSAAGQETYRGDFIANWAHEALFFQAEPWVFTLAYTVFGALVVMMLICVPPNWKVDASAGQADA